MYLAITDANGYYTETLVMPLCNLVGHSLVDAVIMYVE